MALTRTNIIGRIALPDDTNPVNSVVRFVMTGFDTDDTENATIIQIPIDAAIDALGDIDVDLWPNPLGVRSTFYATYVRIPDGNTNDVINVYVGQISVPSTGGPYDLNDLLPIAPPAGADVADYIAQLAAAVALAQSATGGAFADAAEISAADAAASAAGALVSEENALAAAEASGDVLFYDTYADASAALGGLVEGQVVAIFADETVGGTSTRYRVESGVLVFKLDLGQFDRLMELDFRKPRKMWAKMYTMSTAVDQLHWLPCGDSLASRKFVHFAYSLDRMLGGIVNTDSNPAGNNVNTSAGDQLYEFNLVSATSVTGDHTVCPTGVYHLISSGGEVSYNYNGANPKFSKLRLLYIREPSAGTVNLVVNGVTVATASAANATVELGILEHDIVTTAQPGIVKATVTGASVKVLGGHFVKEDIKGLVKWQFLAQGGITPDQMVQTADTRRVHEQILDLINPDIMTLEMDDAFGDGGVNAAALDTILDIWTTAVPYTDKLIIGSTPRAALDNDKRLANIHLREVAQARGQAFLYFDSYTLMGSYADMTAIFGANDGVHPNANASTFAADMLWQHLGLTANNIGLATRPIYTPDVESTFYRGTKLRAGLGELQFNSDATFGNSWDLQFERALAFTDLSDGVTFRISHNTAITSNVFPVKAEFGDGTGKSYDFTAGATYDNATINFKDTANSSGFSIGQMQGLKTSAVAKADLPFAPANARTIRFCSDARADAGGCFVYSDGVAGTWLRVSDDVAVS
jgi:hypothetical protein